MSHTRTVCEHALVVSQCRCIKPHKATEVVRPCPFGDQHLGMVVVHPLPPRPGAMAVRSPDCASGFHTQCPQEPNAPAPRCLCSCHVPGMAQEPAQLPAGAPETPAPVSQDGPEAHSGAEGIYRGALNRYFRNDEFARRVDQTVRLVKLAGVDGPGPLGERWLLTGVIIGIYQAGG